MAAETCVPAVTGEPSSPNESDCNEPLCSYVERTIRLLQLEDEAQQERDKDAESGRPVSIRATASHVESAFFDRTVVYFNPHGPLCFNVKTGAPVTIQMDGNENVSIHGLLVGIEGSFLSIVFDSVMEEKILMNEVYGIKLEQDSKMNLMLTSYLSLLKSDLFSGNNLLKARFSKRAEHEQKNQNVVEKSTKGGDKRTYPKFEPSHRALNDSQQAAVKAILLDDLPIRVVHGPPGTGKTTVLIEALLHLCIERNKRVLCCGPSNKSVDNMLSGLCAALKCKCGRCRRCRLSFVRFGHPVRIDPNLHKHCLDAKMDARKRTIARLNEWALQCKGKHFSSDAMRLQKQNRFRAHRDILQACQIIFATLSSTAVVYDMRGGCSKDNIFGRFDYVFVDECGQALEAMCWAALTAADRAILFGDHCQLPPTVLSREHECGELKKSLLERMVELHPDCVSLLDTQYRMNDKIARWSSKRFYRGLIQSDSSVSHHTVTDLVDAGLVPSAEPLVLIDTNKSTEGQLGVSWYNLDEAKAVYYYVESMVCAGLCPQDIGVITPYSAQQNCIGQLLDPDVYVSTVDGFQGQEKEIIVFSTVRTSGCMEFVADPQRLNVAVTRAKRQFVLVGSLPKLRRIEICCSLINHMIASNAEVIHFSRLVRNGKSLADKLSAVYVSTASKKPPKSLKTNGTARRSTSADSAAKWRSPGKASSKPSMFDGGRPVCSSRTVDGVPPELKMEDTKGPSDRNLPDNLVAKTSPCNSDAEFNVDGELTLRDLPAISNRFAELRIDIAEADQQSDSGEGAVADSTKPLRRVKGRLHRRPCRDGDKYHGSVATSLGAETSTRQVSSGSVKNQNKSCHPETSAPGQNKTEAESLKGHSRTRKTVKKAAATQEFEEWKAVGGCPVCKRSINLLGVTCYACQRKYCPKHIQRELHNCRKCY